MNTLDLIVIWLNLAGCVAAIPINLHAARVGFLIHPGLARTIAVVAGIYAVGYVMLLTGTVHVAAWSDFYRGVSVVVWPLVWSGPALMSLSALRHARREITAATTEGQIRAADDAPRR